MRKRSVYVPTSTLYFLGALSVVSLLWEFGVLGGLLAGLPITDELATFAESRLYIPIIIGALLGHLFFPRKPTVSEFRRWYGSDPPNAKS